MPLEFQKHFRCPDTAGAFQTSPELASEPGFFRFGSDVTCFGQAAGIRVASSYLDALEDCSSSITVKDGRIELPFDPDSVVRNLRNEVYTRQMEADATKLGSHPTIRTMYYWGRPLLPVPMRSVLQRFYLRGETANPFPVWPVDRTVDTLFEKLMVLAIQNSGGQAVPFIWFWPDGASAAFLLTHDVESQAGRDFVPSLMDFDEAHGFKASLQFVPEKRYDLPAGFLQSVKDRGFEVNVHDLNHDGNLFRERKEFLRRAERINSYVREFGSSGFRSGALYRNPLWYEAFQFPYDMSVPNVAHLDPQGGGCCTTFPYFIGEVLEIPVTCTQDYSLFHILNQFSIDLWKRQFEKIALGHGMISVIIHPDYVIEQRARDVVGQMLDYVRQQYLPRGLWSALPSEVNQWWRQRQAMRLVQKGGEWQVEGEGKERAVVAYAKLVEGCLEYSFEKPQARGPALPAAISVPDWSRNPEANAHPARRAYAAVSAVAEPAVTETQPALAPVTPLPAVPRRPLRVAMVAYTFYESDNRVMRYAETLAKRGDHVDIFSLRRENLPDQEVISGVHVHRLQGRLVNEKHRFSYAWRLAMFFLRALFQVSRSDARERYDLFHVHSVPDFLVFTTLYPRLRGTPVILDIHDILPEFYASKFGTDRASAVF
ncbi:MAG TPA: glycosyltransferase, partial [Candidatus Acidoferrum sp.]|nr:glycosyltransferase [Candidatus Acidoferrum sp.]